MTVLRGPFAATLLLSSALATGCGGNKEDARVSAGSGSNVGASGPCSPALPCSTANPWCMPNGCADAGPAAAHTAAAADPNALASLLAAAAAAGSATLGPAATTLDPVEAGLRATATQHAPGMVADGLVAKGTLVEGGHLDFIVQLEPTKCYAIVAFGPGLSDLDIHLLAPPLYNFLAGQDAMAGPGAVVGGGSKPLCPLVPIAVPYKVDLHAKRGSGPVAAQLFSKRK